MEAIWNLLLQSLVSPSAASSDGLVPPPLKRSKFDASSSREAPQQAVLPTLTKINDSVFEVYAPQERRPSVEIIFFHGLQVEGSDKAHVTTWLSRDLSEVWLHWILEKIPNARILTISYDAHVRRTSAEGVMDMYKIRENLVIDLVDAEVGQDGCPVVLVGHCVGGLVMKEVCVQANFKLSLDVSHKPNIPVQNLLHHLKGLFFFASPHHGTRLADKSTSSKLSLDVSHKPNISVQNLLHHLKALFFFASPHHGTRLADKSTRSSNGLLFEDVATNNNQAARRNEDFRKLRERYGWRSFGLVEGRESHLVTPYLMNVHCAELGRTNDGPQICHNLGCKSPISRAKSSLHEDFINCDQRNSYSRLHIVESGFFPAVNCIHQEGHSITFITSFKEGTFTGFIVAESSARHDVDEFYTDTTADHFQVCRPHSRQSSSFQKLSKFVTEVVKEDSKTRQGHKIGFPDEVFGLQDQVNLVLKELKQAPRLGIVGMGGIGKTTLAKTVYNAISQRFEYSCFLPEVKKLFADEEYPDNLRATIVKELYCKGRRVPENFEWSTLKGKSVLIVLDDAKTGSQMRVMTNLDGFLEESRVIVTGRDRGVLIAENFRCHFAVLLNDDDSRKLFCWHAFRTTSAPEGFQDHLQSMLKKCAGLPLALKVAGRYLYTRPKRLWDDALKKLTLAQPLTGATEDGLWSILTVSYDSLAEAEREMFLDVATFFHGQSLNTAKTIWKMCGWEAVECSWENLLDKGLVTQVPQGRYSPFRWPCELNDYLRKMDKLDEFEPDDEGVRDCIIQMHEVLRDLGQSKACPDPRYVVDHTRASYNVFNPEAFRPPNQGQPKLEVLNISNPARCLNSPPRYDNAVIMNIGTFHGLNDLRILSLDGGVLEGALYLFPRRLMCLQVSNLSAWIDSSVDQSSSHISEQCQTLHYLVIRLCFALRTLPSSLQQLHDLRHLTVAFCDGLEVLPSLGRLQALEHLTIDGCESLKALPECFGELQGLKYLRIKGCWRLKRLPDSFGKLRTLQHLEVTYCLRLGLPHTMGQLENLEHLAINDCGDLGTLGNVIGQLIALRHLEVKSCDDSDVPLSNLGRLESLEYLSISESDRKKHLWETLPDGSGELRSLKKLRLNGTRGLEALPNTLGDFPALEVLLLECPSLEILPETLGELQALKTLTIHSEELETLPDSLGQLRALQHLHIDAPLKALPDTVGGLQTLEYLYINAFLKALPDTVGCLQALKYLYIEAPLKALPDTVGGLKALEYLCLDVRDAPDWETLPDTLGELRALKHLELQWFSNVKSIPQSDAWRMGLEHLRLVGCGKISLWDILRNLQALEELEIVCCYGLTALPDTVAKLHAMKRLKLDTCRDLEIIPDSLGQLEFLEQLEIERCPNLKDLPDSLKRRGFTLAPQENIWLN